LNSVQLRILTLLAFTGVLLWSAACVNTYEAREGPAARPISEETSPPLAAEQLLPETMQNPASEEPASVVKGSLRSGETFSQALARMHLDHSLASLVIDGLSEAVDFSKCMPGDAFCITMDEQGDLIQCTFERGPFEVYTLQPGPGDSDRRYTVFQRPIELERHIVKLSGMIDTSLFSAFADAGANGVLTMSFADIFASRIDFNTETRPGDEFQVLCEKYFKDGEFLGYGRILAARYSTARTEFEAYYFKSSGAASGKYYDTTGQEMRMSFLRSPLPAYRLTSGFSNRRLHPVLKIYRPHHGVDLAAPTGTPVMAAADGTVTFAGWQNGYGRIVILKHPGGYQTYYGHLSRFGKGVERGARVGQKQVIGFVGASGLATGPHLDYRVSLNGVFRNPFGMKFTPGSSLAPPALEAFHGERDRLLKLLETGDSSRDLLVETRPVRGLPDGWLG